MLLVDAQVHIWAEETPGHPWPPGGRARAHRSTPLEAEELLGRMDRAGVAGALLVPPGFEAVRNDVVRSAAARYPDRLAAVARIPLDDPAGGRQIAELAADPHVLGVRAVFLRDTTTWLADGTADWLWPLLAQAGLPAFVYAPGQHEEVARVAAHHPDLRLVVDHLGIDVAVHDGRIEPFVEGLLPLARFPNVAVKASSVPTFVRDSDAFPFPSLHGPLRRVVSAFGAERTFWGSDLSRLTCSYEQLRDLFLHHLPFLDDAELALVMGLGLCRWLGWCPTPAPLG